MLTQTGRRIHTLVNALLLAGLLLVGMAGTERRDVSPELGPVVLALLTVYLFSLRIALLRKERGRPLEVLSADVSALAVFLVLAGDLYFRLFGMEVRLHMTSTPLLVLLLGLGGVHLFSRESEPDRNWDTVRTLTAAYLIVAVLATLLSVRAPASRRELVYLGVSMALFLVARGHRQLEENLPRLGAAFLAGYGVLIRATIPEWIGGAARLYGTLPHPNQFAGMLILSGTIFVAMGLDAKKRLFRVSLLVAALSAAFFMAKTGSRAGQIGLMIALAAYGILTGRIRWVTAAIGVFLVVQLVFWRGSTERWERLGPEMRGEVLQNRLLIWRGVLTAPREPYRQWIGFGPGHTLKKVFLETPIPKMDSGLAEVSHAHSIFLQQYAGMGLLGLLFFLALLFASLRCVLPFRRNDSRDLLRCALGAGTIGFLCHGTLDFLLEKQLGLAFWVVLGLLVSSGRRPIIRVESMEADPPHTPVREA